MKGIKTTQRVVFASAFLALTLAPMACAEDPSLYDNETMVFEAPISSKDEDELNLDESASSNFYGSWLGDWGWGAGYGYNYGYAGYGLNWGYPYGIVPIESIPYMIPVAPGIGVIDFVHPFYSWSLFDSWNDDDGGHYHDDD